MMQACFVQCREFFATGLGALGLLGWCRKRKNAAANHLIEFRRDRPEAVFLFAQLAQSRQFSCGRICPLLE